MPKKVMKPMVPKAPKKMTDADFKQMQAANQRAAEAKQAAGKQKDAAFRAKQKRGY